MSAIANSIEKHMASAQCRFSIIRDSIYDAEPDDGRAVDAAIRAGVTCNKIASAIRSGGYKISHSTIQAHKDNTCMCKEGNQWV